MRADEGREGPDEGANEGVDQGRRRSDEGADEGQGRSDEGAVERPCTSHTDGRPTSLATNTSS